MQVTVDADELCKLRAAKKELNKCHAGPWYEHNGHFYLGGPSDISLHPVVLKVMAERDLLQAECDKLKERASTDYRVAPTVYRVKAGDLVYAKESDAIKSLEERLAARDEQILDLTRALDIFVGKVLKATRTFC